MSDIKTLVEKLLDFRRGQRENQMTAIEEVQLLLDAADTLVALDEQYRQASIRLKETTEQRESWRMIADERTERLNETLRQKSIVFDAWQEAEIKLEAERKALKNLNRALTTLEDRLKACEQALVRARGK